jgi:hypothetical protein
MREKMKMMIRKKKQDKSYKKDKKFLKKKPYGQAHIGQEWNSSNESSELERDDLATIAIKGESSSRKSLFPNLFKHTCLMKKEDKKKVRANAPSSPKYVSSDDDIASSDNDEPLPNEFCKNSNAMTKGLMKQVRVRMRFLSNKRNCLLKKERVTKNSRSS